MELYLNEAEQKVRRIAFLHCEDEDNCRFVLEFKHPNSTFFFCKGCAVGFSLDLNAVPSAGVLCSRHGEMERYDVLKQDNVCPKCEQDVLAIVSVGRSQSTHAGSPAYQLKFPFAREES